MIDPRATLHLPSSICLSFVVAVAENGVMGARNQLPWRLPADLKLFKQLTMGKPIVMGRRTYDSIGRPLPGRLNIVISRNEGLRLEGSVVVNSLEAALAAAGNVPEIVIIGGAEIYRQALPRVDTIHLTRVHAQLPGDTFFPTLDEEEWRQEVVSYHAADEQHAHAFSYVRLTRKQPRRASPETSK